MMQRVAEQLADTDALLSKYINILDKSEAVTRLIFDERWEGAEQVRFLPQTPISVFHFIPF